MLIFIIMIVVGSVLAYVSKDNLMLTSLKVGPYIFASIPLFYVIIGSFLSGLILSYIIHFPQEISEFFLLRSKRNEIKKSRNNVLELTKKVHQLELENEKIKNNSKVPSDPRAM